MKVLRRMQYFVARKKFQVIKSIFEREMQRQRERHILVLVQDEGGGRARGAHVSCSAECLRVFVCKCLKLAPARRLCAHVSSGVASREACCLDSGAKVLYRTHQDTHFQKHTHGADYGLMQH